MAKTIHVHVHGKTKDDSSYKGYSIRANSDYSMKTKKMEKIFQIYGPQAPKYAFETEREAQASIDKFLNSNKASSAGDIRKMLKETPYPEFGSTLRTWTKDSAPCSCKSHAKDATLADEIKQVEREILRLEMNPDNVEGGAKAFHSGNRTTLKPTAQRKLDQLNKKLDDLLDKAGGTHDAEPPKLKIVVGENDYGKVWHVQAPDGYTYETFSRRVDAVYWLEQFKRANQKSKDTKDATLVNSDKGKVVRLYTGVIGKVLEVDENKKRACIEVQSAREGTYKMWVDFTEVES